MGNTQDRNILISLKGSATIREIDFAVIRSDADHPFMRYVEKIGVKSLRFVRASAPRVSDHAPAGK